MQSRGAGFIRGQVNVARVGRKIHVSSDIERQENSLHSECFGESHLLRGDPQRYIQGVKVVPTLQGMTYPVFIDGKASPLFHQIKDTMSRTWEVSMNNGVLDTPSQAAQEILDSLLGKNTNHWMSCMAKPVSEATQNTVAITTRKAIALDLFLTGHARLGKYTSNNNTEGHYLLSNTDMVVLHKAGSLQQMLVNNLKSDALCFFYVLSDTNTLVKTKETANYTNRSIYHVYKQVWEPSLFTNSIYHTGPPDAEKRFPVAQDSTKQYSKAWVSIPSALFPQLDASFDTLTSQIHVQCKYTITGATPSITASQSICSGVQIDELGRKTIHITTSLQNIHHQSVAIMVNTYMVLTTTHHLETQGVLDTQEVTEEHIKVPFFLADDTTRQLVSIQCKHRLNCANHMTLPGSDVYSVLSGDHNPIHETALLSSLSPLYIPGQTNPIAHGAGMIEATISSLGIPVELELSQLKPASPGEQLVMEVKERQTGSTVVLRHGQTGQMVAKGKYLPNSIQHIKRNPTSKTIYHRSLRQLSTQQATTSMHITPIQCDGIVFGGQGGTKSQSPNLWKSVTSQPSLANNTHPGTQILSYAQKYQLYQYNMNMVDITETNPTQISIKIENNNIKEHWERIQTLDGTVDKENTYISIHHRELLQNLSNNQDIVISGSNTSGILSLTQFQQLSVFQYEIALFGYYMSSQNVGKNASISSYIEEKVCQWSIAGHSLGEFAAVACLSLDWDGLISEKSENPHKVSLDAWIDTILLRGFLMNALVPRDPIDKSTKYSMVAISFSKCEHFAGFRQAETKDLFCDLLVRISETVRSNTTGYMEQVNINAKEHQYICIGDNEGLRILYNISNALLTMQNIENIDITHLVNTAATTPVGRMRPNRVYLTIPGVDTPFHSLLLNQPLDSDHTTATDILKNHLTQMLHSKNIIQPKKLLLNYTGQMEGVSSLPQNLALQFSKPVQWDAIMTHMQDCKSILEIGSQPVQSMLFQRRYNIHPTYVLQDE